MFDQDILQLYRIARKTTIGKNTINVTQTGIVTIEQN